MSTTLPKATIYSSAPLAQPHRVMVRKDIISLGDLFAFVVPLLQAVEFHIAGLLLAADVALIAALPIALIRHPDRLRQKPIPTVLTLGIFWLAAQVLTDLVRGSAAEDYSRGWLKIVFVLANFTVVWLAICCTRRRFVLYGMGIALGTILSFYIHPSEDAASSPWKFGLGVPVTMLVAIFAAEFEKYRYLGIVAPLSVLAVVHVYKDFRIMAAICFIVPIYSLFLMSARWDKLGRLRLAMLGLMIVGGMSIFGLVYSHYAKLGVFGKYAQEKQEAQTGEGGLLLGGRSEILGSSQAILDSPLLGHGSWARDPKYAAILAERRAALGYKVFQHSKSDDLIPAHSYIFGSWVDAGIGGGIFWIFVLGFTVYTIFNASGTEPLLPLFAFSGLMLIWDILFSPLGTPTRFVAPFFMAAMIVFRRFETAPPENGWET
jgi:hypothetical protein